MCDDHSSTDLSQNQSSTYLHIVSFESRHHEGASRSKYVAETECVVAFHMSYICMSTKCVFSEDGNPVTTAVSVSTANGFWFRFCIPDLQLA